MNTTLRKHLQRQTVTLVFIAYAVCLCVLFCGSLFQNYSMQVETLTRLRETSKSQIDFLLPSFLLPEQSAGKELLLKKFQKEEQLSEIKLETKNEKLPEFGQCQHYDGIVTCRQFAPSKILLAVPIRHGDLVYGYLIKIKNIESGVLGQNFLPIAGSVAIGLLFILVGIIFVVVRLTNFEMPNAIEVLLSDIRSSLDSDGQHKRLSFRFREFEELSEEIYQLIAKARENQKAAAVAQMTQHLAHDVRKPFSMLKTGLNLLRTTNDPREFQSKLVLLTSEVERATKSVDGMLTEVMEVGSTSEELIKESVSPTTLIELTLGEAFRIYPKSDISVKYDLQHAHMVDVHVKKVLRVFSNIVGNAIQAMKGKGLLWFKTREADQYLEYRIGNIGSFIPSEHLPKLFEAFFTSGKKGGTGLGLAIAKKVVTAHGGTIHCESQKTDEYPEGYVEFVFTLPKASGELDITTALLPKHSFDITNLIKSAMNEPTDGKAVLRESSSDIIIINEIGELLSTCSEPFELLFVDDESIYRSGLSSWIEDTIELKNRVSIHHANGSDQALKVVATHPIRLLVTDIDMGPTSLSGFELVTELRSKYKFNGVISVHSNRIVSNDQKRSLDLGANGFLPKPMSKGQLLKLILQALQEMPIKDNGKVKASQVNLVEIAHIEDDIFTREYWQKSIGKEVRLHQFSSPDAFNKRLAEDTDFLKRLSVVVTDYYFDDSLETGVDIGRVVKNLQPGIPVLLSSNGDFKKEQLKGSIDRVIPKDSVTAQDLLLN